MFARIFCALPNFRGKQRIYKYAFLYLPFAKAVSRYGVYMRKNIRDSTYRACMTGGYGYFISNHIGTINRKFVFLDIGSNQGLYSLLSARSKNCIHVFAFEPNPETFSFLVDNIRYNGLNGDITPIQAAIADGGLLRFTVPSNHSGAATLCGQYSSGFAACAISDSALEDMVAAATGHALVMKIDVEGAEPIVLRRLAELGILEKTDVIIIEISTKTGGLDQERNIASILEGNGFTMTDRTAGDHYDAVFVRA